MFEHELAHIAGDDNGPPWHLRRRWEAARTMDARVHLTIFGPDTRALISEQTWMRPGTRHASGYAQQHRDDRRRRVRGLGGGGGAVSDRPA